MTENGELNSAFLQPLSPDGMPVDVADSLTAYSAAYRRDSALFHSPEWINHLAATTSGCRVSVVVFNDEVGSRHCAAGVVTAQAELALTIGRRSLGTFRFTADEILGGPPPIADELDLYDGLFKAIDSRQGDAVAVRMDMVPVDSFCWNYIHTSPLIKQKFIIYVPDGPTYSHYVDIPETYDQYLSKFSSKTRSELRRQSRRLADAGDGRLELRRFERPEDVEPFLQLADAVATRSWQVQTAPYIVRNNTHWRSKLHDLAARKVFRSYILLCGGVPCAVELGYQHAHMFYGIQTFFDDRWSSLSPGTVLLCKYIEDLTLYRPPATVSFGFGDSMYKRMFGTRSSLDGTIYLFRRSLRNRARIGIHAAVRGSVGVAKRCIRRR